MQTIDVADGIRMAPVSAGLAEEMYALVDANRPHLSAWLPWARDQRYEDGLEFLQASVAAMAAGQAFVFGIFVADRLAGLIDLRDVNRAARNAAIGYWLARAHTRKGIMTRCTAQLLDLCFTELELHRVELRAAPGNGPSRRVPERLGFTMEGTLREVAPFHGRWLDLCVYSMLTHEWDSKRSLGGPELRGPKRSTEHLA